MLRRRMRIQPSSAPKGEGMAVFEILKPATKGPIDIQDYREETMAITTPGLVTYRILEFLLTLTPGQRMPRSK